MRWGFPNELYWKVKRNLIQVGDQGGSSSIVGAPHLGTLTREETGFPNLTPPALFRNAH